MAQVSDYILGPSSQLDYGLYNAQAINGLANCGQFSVNQLQREIAPHLSALSPSAKQPTNKNKLLLLCKS
jgi:hypothetical protein